MTDGSTACETLALPGMVFYEARQSLSDNDISPIQNLSFTTCTLYVLSTICTLSMPMPWDRWDHDFQRTESPFGKTYCFWEMGEARREECHV